MGSLANPAEFVRKPRQPNARDRRLVGTENARLLKAAEEYDSTPHSGATSATDLALASGQKILHPRWPLVRRRYEQADSHAF